ncbi:MAG: hypothetical protein JXX28_05095 [Deltaproteobacteria bacterium]|nr:hypothetical protein [Deltaproteobacteria bacterium]
MRFFLVPLLGLLATSQALAVEVDFEGYTRARARLFDDLSLDRSLANAEGTTAYVQHRLWLKPRFLINDHLAVFTEFRGLDGVMWGENPSAGWDPVSGTAYDPMFSDDLAPPLSAGTSSEVAWDAAGSLSGFALWRAWGEVDTDYGRFAFGRMPLHWGMGIWQNDGQGLTSEYGDTVDRLQWQKVIDDVWVQLAVDVNDAGQPYRRDDTWSANAAVGYRAEKLKVGLNTQLRRGSDPGFTLFTGDGALDLTAGNLRVQAEVLGQTGGGDLSTGANGVQLSAYGSALDVGLHSPSLGLGLAAGFASGDRDDTDENMHTFRFDPDYDVGVILFEQPMPVLQAVAITDENGGRSYDQTLIGPQVSNAIFLKPRVWKEVHEGVEVEGSVLWARTAAIPEDWGARSTYGVELAGTVRLHAWDHLELQGSGAAFLPGTYFSGYADTEAGYEHFDQPVYGAQVLSKIDF